MTGAGEADVGGFTRLELLVPNRDAKGLEMREVDAAVFVGADTVRLAGRGGSGGFGGKEDGMRGGRGIEEAYEGTINVGYEIEGSDDIPGRSGSAASPVLRVDRVRRSWKFFEDG